MVASWQGIELMNLNAEIVKMCGVEPGVQELSQSLAICTKSVSVWFMEINL